MREKGMVAFATRNVWVLVLLALLILAIAVSGLRWLGQDREINQQDAQIASLQAQHEKQSAKASAQSDENIYAALGVTSSRLTDDKSVITDVMSTVFTWDSADEYTKARTTLMNRYKIGEKDPFLTSFMPQATFNTDAAGKHYYYIDAVGLNSKLDSDTVSPQVVSVQGNDYHYVVHAEVTMTSDIVLVQNDQGEKQEPTSVKRQVLFYVTVDGHGNISELSGVPATGTVQSSN